MSHPDAESLYAALLASTRDWLQQQSEAPTLVGIFSGGAWLAERLHADLQLNTPLGVVSSTYHRDDFSTRGLHPSGNRTALPFDVNGRAILLVDDVLYTGRTTRAAINELYDFGRPARVDLAVLVDRGGRELPIAPTLCGARLDIAADHRLELQQDPAGGLRLQLVETEETR